MTNRILTTHVGSLVRPPRVMHYVEAIENGVAVDAQAFDACLREEIAQVVRRQAEAGIDIVSDGEFGKLRSWSFYVLDRLGGIEERDLDAPRGAGRDQTLFPEFYAEYFPTQKLPKRGTAVAVAPITYKGHAAIARDIAIFKDALKASGAQVAGAFLPVVAPASAVPRHRNEYYKSDEEFLFALAAALREEYKAIVDAGLFRPGRRCVPALHVRRGVRRAGPCRLSQMGGGAHRRRSITRSKACPRRRCAITSAGAASTRRMSATCRCATSSISCSR